MLIRVQPPVEAPMRRLKQLGWTREDPSQCNLMIIKLLKRLVTDASYIYTYIQIPPTSLHIDTHMQLIDSYAPQAYTYELTQSRPLSNITHTILSYKRKHILHFLSQSSVHSADGCREHGLQCLHSRRGMESMLLYPHLHLNHPLPNDLLIH